jgi:hypothetical protein
MTIEIGPHAVIARHTPPGVASSVIMEGEGFQVPLGGRNGPATSRIAATSIVQKDKPLASPA